MDGLTDAGKAELTGARTEGRRAGSGCLPAACPARESPGRSHLPACTEWSSGRRRDPELGFISRARRPPPRARPRARQRRPAPWRHQWERRAAVVGPRRRPGAGTAAGAVESARARRPSLGFPRRVGGASRRLRPGCHASCFRFSANPARLCPPSRAASTAGGTRAAGRSVSAADPRAPASWHRACGPVPFSKK